MAKRTLEPDAGLQQIDDLEARIILARQQTWRVHSVPAVEQALLMPGVVAEAKAIADKLPEEYHARTQAQP